MADPATTSCSRIERHGRRAPSRRHGSAWKTYPDPLGEPSGVPRAFPTPAGSEEPVMISSRKIYRYCMRSRGVILAASALISLAVVAAMGMVRADDNRAPDLGDCQKLQAPAGSKVAFHAFGVGVQIYRWSGTGWAFVAPEAVLYANAGDDAEIGIHFGGPTWQSNSGSKVVGARIRDCTPDPIAIPWLLLGAASAEGPGIFGRVTY